MNLIPPGNLLFEHLTWNYRTKKYWSCPTMLFPRSPTTEKHWKPSCRDSKKKIFHSYFSSQKVRIIHFVSIISELQIKIFLSVCYHPKLRGISWKKRTYRMNCYLKKEVACIVLSAKFHTSSHSYGIYIGWSANGAMTLWKPGVKRSIRILFSL